MPTAARIADVPCVDWNRPGSSGVLVGCGTGLSMGLMDIGQCLRWYVDFDQVGLGDRAKEMFLRLIDGVGDPLVITGWWTVTSPAGIVNGLAHTRHRWKIWYHGNRDLGVPNFSIGDLVEMLRGAQCRPPAPSLRVRVAARFDSER